MDRQWRVCSPRAATDAPDDARCSSALRAILYIECQQRHRLANRPQLRTCCMPAVVRGRGGGIQSADAEPRSTCRSIPSKSYRLCSLDAARATPHASCARMCPAKLLGLLPMTAARSDVALLLLPVPCLPGCPRLAQRLASDGAVPTAQAAATRCAGRADAGRKKPVP